MFFADLNDNVPVFDRNAFTAVVNENATVSFFFIFPSKLNPEFH